MNKIVRKKFFSFLLNLISAISGIGLISITLLSVYQITIWLGIVLPKDSIFLSLLEIDFFNILTISLMIAALESIIWLLIIGIFSLACSINQNFSKKGNIMIESASKILISSIIPLIAIFALSDSQLSSFINLSALFAVFLFIFRFKRD